MKIFFFKTIRVCLFLLLLTSLTSCSSPIIKNGDLLFVDDTSSELSKAINDVTQKNGLANYTHVGICKIQNDTIYVIHASTKKNVVKEPIEVFLRDRKKAKIDVLRIKGLTNKQLDLAFHNAENMLGMPYDFTYIFGDEKIYCSELIYEMFKKDSIFKLNPMTFKNPKTGEFHKNWIEHYKKLNSSIPEGELGCNPNDMSKNPRLSFVQRLGE